MVTDAALHQFVTVKIPGFRTYEKNVASLPCFEMSRGFYPGLQLFTSYQDHFSKEDLVHSLNVR